MAEIKDEIRETTAAVNYPDSECADCGKKGVCAVHWGPLVPKGHQGLFCPDCWHRRLDDGEAGRSPRPAIPMSAYSLKAREGEERKLRGK